MYLILLTNWVKTLSFEDKFKRLVNLNLHSEINN